MNTEYNGEKVIVTLVTNRRLSMTDRGINMVANSLLGHNKTSGPEPDLYTLYLTEKTFFAEYSRKSLHGEKPKKITKLNIPIEDIVKIELLDRDEIEYLYIKSDWGKEYLFEIGNKVTKEAAIEMIEYVQKRSEK
ncbi:hypothetical protein [Peptostreptococcus faecalis]|uniref:hypothetical protein n=1 Tax=Peptostreptococcus faecalis TaxID=2045015 RepID=UPI000C7D2F5A|nr:hypothetical protein [Peptostreptococcus faecalis]